MKRQLKFLWVVIGLMACVALLVMTVGCTTGVTQTLTTTTTINKTSTISVPAPNPGFVEQKPPPPPPPGGAAAPAPGGAPPAGGAAASPKPPAPGGAPPAGSVAPPGVFTDKAKGTYYGPGKSTPFMLKIPANKNANGDWAACEDNGTLPVEYTCNGSSQSPPLEWSGAPVGTKEFAIVVWHKPPDYAERGAKYYWIMWGIKGTATGLPQNAGAKDTKLGFLGLNEKKEAVFEPSCSSGPGLKTYIYVVYALDDSPQFEKLKLTKRADGGYDGVTRDIFMQAIKDVTIASAVCRVNTDVGNLGGGAGGAPPPPGGAPAGVSTAPKPIPASSGKMVLTSSVVKEGGNMPDKYTRTGAKAGLTTVSPPVAWTGAPAGTKAFAIEGYNGLIFWSVYNIPGTTNSLPEAATGIGKEIQKFITPSEGAPGTFQKHLILYALSGEVNIPAGTTDVEVIRKAMQPLILDTAVLNYSFTVQ